MSMRSFPIHRTLQVYPSYQPCSRDTRLAKLNAPPSSYACIILATAGLARLGLKHRITQRLDPGIFPYAIGQGALGIEVSTDREDIMYLVRHADHKPSRWRCMAERAMLRSLQGGCSSPVGTFSFWDPSNHNRLCLQATVLDMEGTVRISADVENIVESDEAAEQLGFSVAELLCKKGAHQLLHKDGVATSEADIKKSEHLGSGMEPIGAMQ